MNKKRQIVLTIILSRILFFGLGISYILKAAVNFSIISILLGFFLGILILNILIKKDLYNFFKTKLGKIIIIFLCLFLINNVIVAFSILTSNFYLTTTPNILIVISISLVFLYGSNKTIGTLYRFSDFLIVISILAYAIIILFVINNIDINNFLPIKINNYLSIINSIISTAIFLNTPIILIFSLTNDIDRKAINTGYIIGFISIFLITLSIIGIFGIDFSNIIRYPEYIILKKINILNTFEHLENFLSIIWFNDLVLTGILCCFILRKVLNKKVFYIFFITEIFLSYKIFVSNYQNILLLFNYTSYILLIPLIICFFVSLKKET